MMNKVQISKEEQETSIVIDPSIKKATIYTCMPSMIKRIESYREDEDVEVIKEDIYGITIRVPMKWIKIVKPQKREYSEEQRNALRERLEKARAQKK